MLSGDVRADRTGCSRVGVFECVASVRAVDSAATPRVLQDHSLNAWALASFESELADMWVLGRIELLRLWDAICATCKI
jgi:hypothetical protein